VLPVAPVVVPVCVPDVPEAVVLGEEAVPLAVPDCVFIVPEALALELGDAPVWSLCGSADPVPPVVLLAVSPAALGVVLACEEAVADPLVAPIVLDPVALGLADAPGAVAFAPAALCVEPVVVSADAPGAVVSGVAADALLVPEVEDAALLAFVGLLLLLVVPALEFTCNCSLTCLMPVIDFAISLARFLSALFATVPVSIAVLLVTDTCTLANAGSWLNFA